MCLAAGERLGPYEIGALLGTGGMGEVYRARDTRLGRTVALKVLPAGTTADPACHARFEEEARAVAALNHPNICVLYDIGTEGGTDYLVMEYLEGRSLADEIKHGPLPLDQALRVAIQMADALDKAHRSGVVHRDLKPGNVMLTDSGAKLLDFGLAKLTLPGPEGDPCRAATKLDPLARRLIGTPCYMSPEQARGLPIDHRSDIFSMGIVVYEMVTGRRPFEGTDLVSILASIIKDPHVPATRVNRRLPLRLGRLIDRCLEKDPARRWQSIDQFKRYLEELRTDLASAARATDRSIAVLPFSDMSPGRDQGYLCEGIAEEILIALSQVKGLRVASRASAFRFRSPDRELVEVAGHLRVSTLLDGTVRKAGDLLRITVSLVDGADGFCLWSARYERDMRDVFAVEDEIARAVVTALEMSVSPADREAIQRLATSDVGAYECYLRGRSYFFKYDKRGIACARELFERALAIDPEYARAWAGTADCSAYIYMYGGRDPADLARALSAARAAVALNAAQAEAHASLGTALSLLGQHAEAESSFREAIRLNPNLFEAHYFYARDSFAQGKLEQAIEQYEEAWRVRPEDYQSPLLVAQIHEDSGHPDAAKACRRHGVAIAEQYLAMNPDDVRALYMGANGLVALGEIEKGLAWARRAVLMEPDDPMLLYNVACVFSLAGRVDDAIGYVEQAVNAGLTQREWLEHDSNLDPIRATARFEAVMARL